MTLDFQLCTEISSSRRILLLLSSLTYIASSLFEFVLEIELPLSSTPTFHSSLMGYPWGSKSSHLHLVTTVMLMLRSQIQSLHGLAWLPMRRNLSCQT